MLLAAALTALPLLTACGAAPEEDAEAGAGTAATATSLADFGDMDALVEAAEAEGRLNVIALPHDWANYGELIARFQELYDIEVDEEDPSASSAEELEAIRSRRGQDRAPDVVDIGASFAFGAAEEGLFAPYRVRGWDDIPDNQKDADGLWFHDYGGFVSIGCDAATVGTCPRTFEDLRKPEYRNMVALNGNPTMSGSAIAAVQAAAQANGGSLDDVQPGIDFFAELREEGNFIPVEATPATIEKGETPITIDWDYLNAGYADQLDGSGVEWTTVVPTDGVYAQYYVQAINKDAPNPAAARLWMEFLYGEEGQNLWLKGYARPVLLPAMERDGTADAEFLAKLPPVTVEPEFPTPEQLEAARDTVNENWERALS
ncbi:extracellular solute-binding protein [Streptomyces alkaliphilus]|uniref:Extracellular solute-binding protein n=1 Tax=Streptomyces alkaliphilus TaxID=1472722 RepID=A0A7W3TGD0_9ACTN|nr:extracellular solute-binding protein [Streptomyces alkaliphilus]MBB0246338.1 extracellular solute-binding protein [Streptomyces alkaliphilus]